MISYWSILHSKVQPFNQMPYVICTNFLEVVEIVKFQKKFDFPFTENIRLQ